MKPNLKVKLVGLVVQSLIKLTEDKQEFWFNAFDFAVRFSVYVEYNKLNWLEAAI